MWWVRCVLLLVLVVVWVVFLCWSLFGVGCCWCCGILICKVMRRWLVWCVIFIVIWRWLMLLCCKLGMVRKKFCFIVICRFLFIFVMWGRGRMFI